MSIKTYGLETFKEAISYNIDLAEKTEDLLRKSKNWEIVSQATLAIINFRYNPIGVNLTEPEIDKLNQEFNILNDEVLNSVSMQTGQFQFYRM